ncbi:hypothetical protein BBJ28_00015673 [Nothophytophthora sp. Chile5]|nr:hypothetical protein BBJ28_00015673 [Nothophytophthora sp. Chile5]
MVLRRLRSLSDRLINGLLSLRLGREDKDRVRVVRLLADTPYDIEGHGLRDSKQHNEAAMKTFAQEIDLSRIKKLSSKDRQAIAYDRTHGLRYKMLQSAAQGHAKTKHTLPRIASRQPRIERGMASTLPDCEMTRKKKASTSAAKEAGASSASVAAHNGDGLSATVQSSPSFSSPTPAPPSFKELQRLHAMRMELFGFGGWLASTLFYGGSRTRPWSDLRIFLNVLTRSLVVLPVVLFLMWAYVPETTLEAYGFTYFPSKHWAVAVPALIVVTYLFSLVLYKAVNLMSTPSLGSYATILDVHTVALPEGRSCFVDDTAATPGIGDISIFEVNRHLFSVDQDQVDEQ